MLLTILSVTILLLLIFGFLYWKGRQVEREIQAVRRENAVFPRGPLGNRMLLRRLSQQLSRGAMMSRYLLEKKQWAIGMLAGTGKFFDGRKRDPGPKYQHSSRSLPFWKRWDAERRLTTMYG